MSKKHLCILICILVNALTMASANNRTITGVVISGEDNQPLIGASVYIHADELKKAGMAQQTVGTITDIDGKFSLSVPDKVTRLHCSYIGFEEQTIALQGDKKNYRIVLQPSAHALADVVVTGYQTLERRKLTAAIAKVELSDAMVGAAKSIDQALTGQIAGVAVTNTSGAPGAPAKIRIRGTASMRGTQDPLWVLDGIPLEGTDIQKLKEGAPDNDIVNIGQSSIAGLSPNDIESITILKDAAATAIYGARAANGVIVITSKRGRSGKPVVNFNAKLTYTPNLDTSRLNLLNAEEKVNLELQLMSEPTYLLFGFIPTSVYEEKGGVATILKKYKLLNDFRNEGWNGLTPDAQNAINRLKTINTDWNDILFRDALTQEYNVSISGGSEKVTYYNSMGYTKENGNVPGVSFNRFNLTTKTSYQINKLLKVGVSIFANRRKNQTFMTDLQGLTNPIFYSRIANPYFEPFDQNNNYLYDYEVVAGSVTNQNQGFNIYEERANTSKESINTAINSIFDAELRFNDQWKLTSQIGVQWEQLSQEEFAGMKSFNIRNQREKNTYTDSKENTIYIIPEGGMLKTTNSSTSQITWKVQGEYKNTFNDVHDIQIMAGSEIRKNWYENAASTGYGYDPKTLTFKNLNLRESDLNDWKLKSKSYIENAFASFFANGSYTLMNRYTLGGSIRMDGSDLFGVDKKYRFLPIYSVSGMWRLSNEPFMSPYKWIDNLAFRLSYGLQGNIDKNTSPFLVGSYGNVTILPGEYEENITIGSAPNSKLRWEKTTSYNAGIDFSVFNQGINLSVDYYYRKGTDLIGDKMLPLENGFTSMVVNWASMENQGIEVNLQTRNIATKNFSWYTSFNFAYNQNKVLRVMVNKEQATPSLEGYPVGAIFALKTQGINPDTGQILIENKEGKGVTIEELLQMTPIGDGYYDYGISAADQERELYSYIGTSDAPYTGGLMNTFNYRNWELNLNFSYNLGAYVKTTPSYHMEVDPARNLNKDILDRWTLKNKDGKFPALATPRTNPADYRAFTEKRNLYNSLDIWVKKLSYVRLQNIRLAYHVPSEWLHKVNIGGATVGLEARNLFVFGTSYKNYMDPESMGNLYSTPLPKSVTFNLSLNF